MDPELVEYLKEWRRGVAVRDNVPAFMVLHDATLEDLCRKQPRTHAELLHVSGIGERKAVAHGAEILAALRSLSPGSARRQREAPKVSPAEETMRLLKEGRNFEEIAQLRERRLATVVDLVAELVERGRLEFDPKWMAPERREQIEAAIQQLGAERHEDHQRRVAARNHLRRNPPGGSEVPRGALPRHSHRFVGSPHRDSRAGQLHGHRPWSVAPLRAHAH